MTRSVCCVSLFLKYTTLKTTLYIPHGLAKWENKTSFPWCLWVIHLPMYLSHPFPYHAVYCHQEIRLWPPCQQLNLCITITSKGRDSVVKPTGYFLYFFTCHHCLNILINTFKCPGKSSSICMTAREDNDEGLSSITIRVTFEKVSKRMSLYEYVYVGAVHKSVQ